MQRGDSSLAEVFLVKSNNPCPVDTGFVCVMHADRSGSIEVLRIHRVCLRRGLAISLSDSRCV